MKPLPVMPAKCATCPFRPGSEFAYLADDLAACAMTTASRVCHSTGTSAIMGRTGKPARLCRGARDVQLELFFNLGFIEAPTDAAWQAKAATIATEAAPCPKKN